MSEHSMVITSKTSRRFLVRILRRGDRYGFDDCLTWASGEPQSPSSDAHRPGVEFYDYTYADVPAFTPRGQFVSRYYADTILDGIYGTDVDGPGLDLDGGVDVWKIDGAAMKIVRAWLAHELKEN